MHIDDSYSFFYNIACSSPLTNFFIAVFIYIIIDL